MRITVAVTGASGSIYAYQLLRFLAQSQEVEQVYLIVTTSGSEVARLELDGVDFGGISPKIVQLSNESFWADIASGSNAADAMVVVPCSMGTIGRIASGVSTSLLERAADVQLKERLPLILVARETPYSLIHLQNMGRITEAGGMILPASPSFYSKPQSVEQVVETVVERIIDKLGIKNEKKYRWNKKL